MAAWRGPTTLKLVDDEWDITAEKLSVVLTYQGPRADCRSSAPELYVPIAGYPGVVTSVKIPGCQTPDGRLIITCDAVNDTIYEIEWATCFKKLLTNPIFQPGGAHALADADLNLITTWTNAADGTAKGTAYAALTDAAKYYVDKIKLGEEEYPVSYPIARMTTKTPQTPEDVGEGMYTVEDPPAQCNAPSEGWTYYKSADTCLLEARIYARRQEWTGAQKLDSDIFGS